jgi:hypothetical protein
MWKTQDAISHLDGITSFNDKPNASPEELAESMLETIEEHHPRWNVLLTTGARTTTSFIEALNKFGFLVFSENNSNIEFRRERV